MTTLQEVFIHELQDLYSAESQIAAALSKLEKACSTESLAKAFATHREQTRVQKERLDQMAELLNESLNGETCKAMQGLVKEAEGILEEFDESPARDIALIAAAQRVEHYEIAAYGSVVEMARSLGHDEVLELLETTLTEEKETDVLLTEIATSEILPATLDGSESTSESSKSTSPPSDDLTSMTKEELYELAKEREIEGRSSMNKDELVEALS